MSRRARAFLGAFGAVATVVNAPTDTLSGVRKVMVIPLRVHRTADLVSDPLYAVIPLVTGIAHEPRARGLWLATAGALAGAVALTDWDAG